MFPGVESCLWLSLGACRWLSLYILIPRVKGHMPYAEKYFLNMSIIEDVRTLTKYIVRA
jgi:hypothetical protein